MIMLRGQRYRCQDRECRAEMEVKEDSIEGGTNPRCWCGAEMKKRYGPPVLRSRDTDGAVLADHFRKKV
jgi:hypothetical protein